MPDSDITYYTIPPPPALAAYVRFFWVLEGQPEAAQPFTHRSMADVCAELIFHYCGVFEELKPDETTADSARSGLQGPSRSHSRYRINRHFGIFGVYLYPHVLPLLFHRPATELADQYLDLPALLGWVGRELEERMMLAATNHQRVQLISGFLERQLHRRPADIHPGVYASLQCIRQTAGMVRVRDLADTACLSERQFERHFRQLTGFSPKLYARIIRFHAVFRSYHTTEPRSLTELALACGYYDQSHFIDDFRQFSGLNPKAFFSDALAGKPWLQGT